MPRLLLLALLAALALLPRPGPARAEGETVTVSGTVTYRERILLPPGARLEVVVEDVSRADAPAERLAVWETRTEGAPPWRFSMEVPADRIDPAASYALRARLERDGRLIMTTDTHVPVLTRGAGTEAELILKAVPRSGAADAPEPGPLPAHGLRLPATFRGTLPAASGGGVVTRLDLWADGGFHLEERYEGGTAAPIHSLGRWAAEPQDERLTLRTPDGAVRYFAVTGPQGLRQMTPDGAPIVSDLPYDLTGGPLEPPEIAGRFRGALRYMADAAVFADCLTGQSWPVAFEGDWPAAERAYLALGPEGAPVTAVVEGRVETRPAMEGPDRPTLVIDRFAALLPDTTCERAQADSALVNTYWRLRRIGEETLGILPANREPHLALSEGAQPHWRATVGCNTLLGQWSGTAAALSFQPGPTTLMACPPPLDRLERGLIEALADTREARITGPLMELFDAEGTRLAVFEAVYLY